MKQEEAVVDEDIAYRCACLAICRHVRKHVRIGKAFVPACGSDAASDVDLPADNIVPDSCNGIEVGFVILNGCNIGHPGIHIGCPDRMPHSLSLIHNFFVSLVVLLAFRAPDVEEKPGKVKIFLFPGHAVQLDKPHLDHLVPGVNLDPVPAKILVDKVSRFYGDIKKRSLSRCLVMRNGSLI